MCVAFFLHYYMCCKPTDRIKELCSLLPSMSKKNKTSRPTAEAACVPACWDTSSGTALKGRRPMPRTSPLSRLPREVLPRCRSPAREEPREERGHFSDVHTPPRKTPDPRSPSTRSEGQRAEEDFELSPKRNPVFQGCYLFLGRDSGEEDGLIPEGELNDVYWKS